MANNEVITCDFAGCSEPFAYRIRGFNLCAEHCFEKDEFFNWVKSHIPPAEPEGVQKS